MSDFWEQRAITRLFGKRWELRATPWMDNPLSQSCADEWNDKPERFWTRRHAAHAVHFYADILGMPVTFWVLDRKDRP